jgi:hypothetical protein
VAERNDDFLDRVRKLDQDSIRKHHLVPRSYLVRWAVENQIRVTETSTAKSYITSPERAAKETDFYRIETEDPDFAPPLLFEAALGEFEGRAQPCLDVLVSDGPDALGPQQALDTGIYLGLQYARGRAVRQQIQQASHLAAVAWVEAIPDDKVAEILQRQGTDATPEAVARAKEAINALSEGKIRASPVRSSLVAMAMDMGLKLWPFFLARRWKVLHSSLPLITSDEPVAMIGGPGSNRRVLSGHATARVATFPLDPHHLLAMFHPGLRLDATALVSELTADEARQLNIETASNSYRWCFERPKGRQTLTIAVPPLDVAARSTSYRSADSPDESLIVLTRPSRWARTSTAPDWPIERWWRHVGPGTPDSIPFDPDNMEDAMFNTL